MKKRYVVSIFVSFIFLYLALRNVQYKNVREALTGANYIFVIPAMLMVVVSFVLRGIRWGYFFEKKIKFQSLFGMMMIGFMVNNILPARIGEITRAYMIGKKENISRTLSFGTIVLERVFDGLSLLFILGLSMLFSPFPAWVKGIGLIGLFVFCFSLAFLVILRLKRVFMVKSIENLLSIFHKGLSLKISSLLTKFIEGLVSLESLKNTWIIIIYSIVAQIILAFEFHILFFCFGLDIPFYAAYFTASMVGLSSIIPSAPGYIGVFQSFCVGSLLLFGVKKDIALSYSIITHIVQYIPVTLIGLFYMINEHIPISSLQQKNTCLT